MSCAAHVAQRRNEVIDLRLGHVHDRIVAEARIRPEEQEEIRKAGDRRAEIRLRAAAPRLAQRAAVAPAYPIRNRRVGDPEPGAENDCIDVAFDAVGGDDRSRANAGNGIGDHLHVRLRQRGIVVVRQENALAAHRVVRRQLRAQGGIGDALLEEAFCKLLHARHHGRMPEHDDPRLAIQVDQKTNRTLHRRHARVETTAPFGNRRIGTRDHPCRRALKDREPRGALPDLRDELDC